MRIEWPPLVPIDQRIRDPEGQSQLAGSKARKAYRSCTDGSPHRFQDVRLYSTGYPVEQIRDIT